MCTSRPPTAANCCSPDIPNQMPSCAYCSISSNSRCQRSRHPKSPPRRLLRNPAVVKTFEPPRTETQRLKPLKMHEPAKSGYVSRSLITKDRTETSAGLRIPAAEIEHLVSSRVHRWLLDPGSIHKSTSARLTDASMQQRLVARAADLGKYWPQLPVARKRAVLAALVERIEVSLDQIEIRLRPPRG